MNSEGRSEEIFKLTSQELADGLECHEPRPIIKRSRERIIPPRTAPESETGFLLLSDVNHGRNMDGVEPGDIKKLLVLETLPMPIHYTGGMEPISYGGTFTLERILGTVPVESDGSAYFEVPALRSLFFVALDENDLSVKRMQSFTSVMPGETLSCAGCHEHRSQTPRSRSQSMIALQNPPHPIEPISDVPDVIDFPRDVQPVLNDLCVGCHDYEATELGGPRAGGIILSGDHGPMFSHSYYTMTVTRLFSDGRNQPKSNYEPRTLGSSASRLLAMLDGSHHGVQATPWQSKMLRLWIESAAAYPGTYAALGTGMIGNYAENRQVNTGMEWRATRTATRVIERRCASCHQEPSRLLPLNLADERGVSFWQPSLDDPRLKTSRHIVFNLTRPEKSLMLLAPLSEKAGGWGLCRDDRTGEPVEVFTDSSDPGYQSILALCVAGKEFLNRNKRSDMPDFAPRADWVREMIRYGVLSENISAEQPMDVYAVEQLYWKSLWHQPVPEQAELSTLD